MPKISLDMPAEIISDLKLPGISDMKSLIKFSNLNSDFNFIHTSLSNEVKDQNLSCLKSIPERTSVKSAFGFKVKKY